MCGVDRVCGGFRAWITSAERAFLVVDKNRDAQTPDADAAVVFPRIRGIAQGCATCCYGEGLSQKRDLSRPDGASHHAESLGFGTNCCSRRRITGRITTIAVRSPWVPYL